MTESLTCEGCPGWDALCARVTETLARLGYSDCPPTVKEKYGTLRIDIGAASLAIHDAIDALERESERTCQRCGKPGRYRISDGWVRTLCDWCVPVADRPELLKGH